MCLGAGPPLVGDVDPARVARIARRHRVAGLLYHRLESPALAEPLRPAAMQVQAASLALAAESLRLSARFEAAGLRHLFLKGEALGVIGYGRLGIKQAVDIDILYDGADPAALERYMADAGYDRVLPSPALTPADMRLWFRLMKDSGWRHRTSGIQVEMHHRPVGSTTLLHGIDAASASERVALAPGRSVPTLARSEHYAYLCTHGAVSGWSRLKWLADLAALIAAPDTPPLADLHATAERHGAGLASELALHMIDALAGSRLIDRIAPSRPIAARLAARHVARLGGAEAVQEEAEFPLGIRTVELRAQWPLSRAPRHRWYLFRLVATSFPDRAALRLPRGLRWLYAPIRGPRTLARIVADLRRR